MPELAKAYVQIIPSAEGIKGNLGSIMDGEAESAGKSSGSKFGSVFGSVAAAGLKAVGAGMVAASGAVVKFAKDAVSGYADFEQLVGGVETLFTPNKSIEEYAEQTGRTVSAVIGEYIELSSAADTVKKNASEAFRTVGISANEYMETVTGFSAALISSVGGDTAKAADMADMALRDMSDNANKMGSSMESIQNAYSGFSKQNYTMLDNLKLGYGGTKEEMKRLLEDAEKISGITYDIESYADVVDAIHVIQTEMGITGTTAKEASTTISGSIGSMKAAWKNLLVGLADPGADLSSLINDVVETAETAFGNILPVAEQALGGIATLIEKLAPVIAAKLPALVERVLPSLLSAAASLLSALVTALPSLVQVLIEQGPVIINQLIGTVLVMLPELVKLGLELITSLALGIAESLPALIPSIVGVILEIVEVLTEPDMLMKLIDAAIQIIEAVAEGLILAIPKLVEAAPTIIMNLVEALIRLSPQLIASGLKLVGQLVLGISQAAVEVFGAIADIVAGAKEAFMARVESAKQWGRDLIQNFIDGILEKWNKLKESVGSVAQKVKDFLGFSEPKEGPLSNFHTYAPDMMALFAKGIRDNEDLITDQIEDSFDLEDGLRVNAIVRAGAHRFGGSASAASYEAGAEGSVQIIAQAVAAALNGCGVYMDGQVVGRLVTRAQSNAARAYG